MSLGFSRRRRFAGFELVSFNTAIMVLVSRRKWLTETVRQVQDAPAALAVPSRPERNPRRACPRSHPTNSNREESAQGLRRYRGVEFEPPCLESENLSAVALLVTVRSRKAWRSPFACFCYLSKVDSKSPPIAASCGWRSAIS